MLTEEKLAGLFAAVEGEKNTEPIHARRVELLFRIFVAIDQELGRASAGDVVLDAFDAYVQQIRTRDVKETKPWVAKILS